MIEDGRVEVEAQRGVPAVALDESRNSVQRDELSTVYDGHTITERLGFFHIMRGQNDGFATVTDATHNVPHGKSRLWVKSSSQLIEEKQLGIMDEGEGNKYSLAFTAGQLGNKRTLFHANTKQIQQRPPRNRIVIERRK